MAILSLRWRRSRSVVDKDYLLKKIDAVLERIAQELLKGGMTQDDIDKLKKGA